MTRLLLLILLALTLGAASAYFLRAETGYVLVSYGDWIVETSVLGLTAAVVSALLLVYYGLRLLIATLRLPQTVRHALGRRRSEKARASFETGLLRLLEGNWKQAEIDLVRRAADHHAAHLNYLAAARAAQRLAAPERRDHYLMLARRQAPELELATLLTQAELQRERGEWALTRDTALRIRERDTRLPYAIELLAEAHAALGEWEPLRVLLTQTQASAALTPARWHELMRAALLARLAECVDAARLDQLKALWDAAAAALRADAAVLRAYAQGLGRLNAAPEALALILKTLKQGWDGELVLLYGELAAGDALAQLANIEEWLQRYGERPELLITAGRACMRNRLWGKARSYLEAVIRSAPTPAAYLELARLCEQTQNPTEAGKFLREGLELAASQPATALALGQVSKA